MIKNKNEIIKNITLSPTDSLNRALKIMDKERVKLLLVMEDDKLKGLISIGDIQRKIINNIPLTSSIEGSMKTDYLYSDTFASFESIKEKMLKYRLEFMPIINNARELKNIIFWDEIFIDKLQKGNLGDIPVVIMAGGKGTRLKPITNILPKPLIPVGNKTIVEHILQSFTEVGCNHFFMMVNYKADMIVHYFNELNDIQFNIEFVREPKFLGTAGSLYLLREKLNSTFFVNNCDIIIDADYKEILNFHNDNNNFITIVGIVKHYQIEYGVLDTAENGVLINIKEKPEYTFIINSGMYILNPQSLNLIPENEFFHITDLIETARGKGYKIGVFPLSEGSWMDIGEWKEYNATARKLGYPEVVIR